jgi:hypothetical protein
MSDDPRSPATKDSGVLGIPVPATSQRIDDADDGYRVTEEPRAAAVVPSRRARVRVLEINPY